MQILFLKMYLLLFIKIYILKTQETTKKHLKTPTFHSYLPSEGGTEQNLLTVSLGFLLPISA